MLYQEKCYIKIKLPKNHRKADCKNKMLYQEKCYIKKRYIKTSLYFVVNRYPYINVHVMYISIFQIKLL